MSLIALALAAALVEVGLDRLAQEGGGPLHGRRVGLVSHAASVTAAGRPALDVLRGAGVQVVRLFAPEHGLSSRAAAGKRLADGVADGLPVVSLYGVREKPTPEDLAGLDAVIFDLQDAGVRFYTYEGTLILLLEAVAEAGIELVVLDRPNPLGGLLIEGPLVDPDTPRTLGTLAPGPLVHGLTVGELARYVNSRRPRPARLTVVPMRGWTRSMTWADSGRPWTPPSPNLKTAEAALAYPGTALLEATNVSEGRGTDAPFLSLGAPWLDGEALGGSLRVAGFTLVPARFEPQAAPEAPHPKHAGQECGGLRVGVTDAPAARPYRLGLALLAALRRHAEFRWRAEGALDALIGTARVREALERGDGIDAIIARDDPAIAAFRQERSGALLYE